MPNYYLIRFNLLDAPLVASWLLDADDVATFTGERHYPIVGSDVAIWSRDATSAHLLLDDGEPVAYGEVVEDDAEGDIEIARLILAPDRRTCDAGQVLIASLCEVASRLFPYDCVWLRVGRADDRTLSNGMRNGFVEDPAASGQNFIWLRKQLCR